MGTWSIYFLHFFLSLALSSARGFLAQHLHVPPTRPQVLEKSTRKTSFFKKKKKRYLRVVFPLSLFCRLLFKKAGKQKSACSRRTSRTLCREKNKKKKKSEREVFSRKVKFSYLSEEKLWNLRRRRRRRRSRRRRLGHVFPAPFRLSAGVKSQVFHGRNIVRQRRGRNVREPTEEWGGERGGERKRSGSRGEVGGLKETPTILGPPALVRLKSSVLPAQPQSVTPSLNEGFSPRLLHFGRCRLLTPALSLASK